MSFRDKEHLAALRFRDDAFVLETMYWPDEIRDKEARVTFDPARVGVEQLIQAVKGAGFRAFVKGGD